MTPTMVIEIGRQAVEIMLLVSAPLFLAALVTGLIVSVFQAATQINEMTLSFIPKLVAMFVTLIVAGPWMLTMMVDYMRQLFESIPGMIG
jgi:flagellar biosynthetic protein FliQ